MKNVLADKIRMSVSDTFAFISFALINNIKFVLLIVLVSNKAFFCVKRLTSFV